MGFEVVTVRKGIFVDSHEWPDVIRYKYFLRKMVKIGFLHFICATEEARQALSEHVDPPILDPGAKRKNC